MAAVERDPPDVKLTRSFIVLTIAFASSSVAIAQAPDESADLRTLRVEVDSGFEPDELADIEAGARAVPARLRDAVGPVRFRRVRRPCLYGMGRYSSACPTWDDEGRFLIYDVPPLQGEGPVWRLQQLDRSERVSVQRQRAVVHAFVSKWDEEAKWSDEPIWRMINGWTQKTDPQNVYRWGYSRFMGQRSPRLDLVTFAEEFFVRPETVIDRERRDALDPNLGVACQDFTKSRFVKKHLVALDPAWRADDQWFDRCPEFESWARTQDVDGIDVLIAAATADRPESLYGHLLLHVQYRGASVGFEPVYQFGAVTDSDVGMIDYFTRGLLGGFVSAIEIADFRSVDRRILQDEQRTLRHYRLNLDRRQILHLQQRLWEAERRVRYPYFFLDDNCASFLYDLVAPALGIELDGRGSFIVTPTDVLDTLAETSNSGRGPLLTKSTTVHYSSRARAQQGVTHRRQAVSAFADEVGGAPDVERLARQIEEAPVEERATLYPELAAAFAGAIDAWDGELEPSDDAPHRLALDYFVQSSRVERFVVEVAARRTRARRLRTLDIEPQSAEEMLAKRETLYMFEDLERRSSLVEAWTREADELLSSQDADEMTPAARQALAREKTAKATYAAAIGGMSTIIDRFEPDLDAVGYLDRKESNFRAEEARRNELAVGPSGKNRLVLGAGAIIGDRADATAVSGVLKYAFIAEYLGEQRRRGLRPDIESQVFDLQLNLPFDSPLYRRIDAELTLIGFKTIEQPLDPVRDAWDDFLGWGFDGIIRHDGARDLWTELALGGGYIWPAWKADDASSHLLFGLYPEARALFVSPGAQGHVAARAFTRVRLHTGGSYANALSFEASTGQAFQFPLWDWAWRSSARLAWDIGIGRQTDPLVVRPYVEGDWTNETYRTDDVGEPFWRVRSGIELEL